MPAVLSICHVSAAFGQQTTASPLASGFSSLPVAPSHPVPLLAPHLRCPWTPRRSSASLSLNFLPRRSRSVLCFIAQPTPSSASSFIYSFVHLASSPEWLVDISNFTCLITPVFIPKPASSWVFPIYLNKWQVHSDSWSTQRSWNCLQLLAHTSQSHMPPPPPCFGP